MEPEIKFEYYTSSVVFPNPEISSCLFLFYHQVVISKILGAVEL